MNQVNKSNEFENVVAMQGIVKRFPGVIANDHVDFELRRGEVHALLGENGAGKSTLMNVLAGLYRADGGSTVVHGNMVNFGSPREAIEAGIGMVHQHFMLVPSQSVTENVLLGLDEPRFRMKLKEYPVTSSWIPFSSSGQQDPKCHPKWSSRQFLPSSWPL